MLRNHTALSSLLGATLAFAACTPNLAAQSAPFSAFLNDIGPAQVVSTIPSNGDVNPYGVAFVPTAFPTGGLIQPGDILVSNYNNSQNLQGTGTTIVTVRQGQPSLFFQGKPGLGLSTGLSVLRSGYVIVGNFPTTDGTPNTAQPGSILAIDRNGNVVWNYSIGQLVDGPWDLTVNDQGGAAQIFVANVLSGTVSRLDITVNAQCINLVRALEVASGYGHRGDPAALEVGPCGLAYDAFRDTLYVASSLDNEVYGIPNAGKTSGKSGKGYPVYKDDKHLHGVLAMILAPNGDLIASNNDVVNPDPNHGSELVEFTPAGKFVAEFEVDNAPGGSFGLNVGVNAHGGIMFAAVDDNTSSLEVFNVTSPTPIVVQ